MNTEFWWENLMEGDHLEDPGVDGRIILRLTIKQLAERMDCNDLVQDRDRWWVIVGAVMSPRFSSNEGSFFD